YQSFVQGTTGKLFPYDDPSSQQPDAFIHNLYDDTFKQDWESMTEDRRKASAVGGALVWTGPNVTRFVAGYLSHKPHVVVSAPSPVAGTYSVGTAAFGAAVGSDINGSVVASL